jgi:maltose alpha-D-glucosyltransferase/alpha-amylase
MEVSGDIRSVGAEQSNVSVIVGDSAMLKIYRRLRAGEQPEIEVARFLTEVASYPNTPAFYGSAEYLPAEGAPMALAAAFAFVRNQGDAWTVILDALDRHLDEFALAPREETGPLPTPEPAFSYPLDLAAILGRRTAELHVAFATPTDDPAFAAEPIGAEDLRRWVDAAAGEAERSFDRLEHSLASLTDDVRPDLLDLIEQRRVVFGRYDEIRSLDASGLKTRIHGDFHLGQVLVAQDDVMIIDFEGEPQRDLAERREKSSGLRDVAGMLRSFDYAAWSALDRLRARHGQVEPHVGARAFAWRNHAVREFLAAYTLHAERVGILPNDAAAIRSLLDLFLLQKAFYEIGYEAANRPAWLSIPVRGILDLLSPQNPAP